jgi:prevent-host-death family protein
MRTEAFQQQIGRGQEIVNRVPVIVPVSVLRRDTARLIENARRSHDPLFITQRGYVTAVLLSREEYDTACVLRDRGLRAINPRAFADEPPQRVFDVVAPDDWDE